MKIASWNINGVRAIVKKDLFKSLKDINADIYCFQETKAQDDQVEAELGDLDYHLSSFSAVKKGYSGTAILSKVKPQNIIKGMGIDEFDDEGRVLTAEFKDFYLVNVYAPNASTELKRLDYKERWNKAFLEFMQKLEKTKPVISCGDFNVAHQAIDLKNDKSNYNKTAGYTQVEIDGMTNFIQGGFRDVYREFYPDKIEYTYWSYRFKARERNTGWRIDYFLASKDIEVENISILNTYLGSDHCPVLLELP